MRSRGDRRPLPPGFGTIWTTVAVDLIGFGVVLPLLPLYATRFHAGAFTVGAMFASFSVAQLVFAPVWGRISDRVGRKPVLILSLFGTAAGTLLTGLAGSLALLFVGRIVDGASGASVSVAPAAVADVAPPKERARLFGLLGAAFGVGFIAGPPIGGVCALVDGRLQRLRGDLPALRPRPARIPAAVHRRAVRGHWPLAGGRAVVARSSCRPALRRSRDVAARAAHQCRWFAGSGRRALVVAARPR